MAVLAGLGLVATVVQVPWVDIGRLIFMILQAVETAHENKEKCKQLGRSVSMITDLLPHLQLDPDLTRRPLAELGNTLREAHKFVLSCQESNAVYRLVKAETQAVGFRDLQSRIDYYVRLFGVISNIAIARRLDRNYQVQLSNHAAITRRLDRIYHVQLSNHAVQGGSAEVARRGAAGRATVRRASAPQRRAAGHVPRRQLVQHPSGRELVAARVGPAHQLARHERPGHGRRDGGAPRPDGGALPDRTPQAGERRVQRGRGDAGGADGEAANGDQLGRSRPQEERGRHEPGVLRAPVHRRRAAGGGAGQALAGARADAAAGGGTGAGGAGGGELPAAGGGGPAAHTRRRGPPRESAQANVQLANLIARELSRSCNEAKRVAV